MKRFLKILRRVVVACVFLFAMALGIYVFILPGIVRGEIRDALADLGFPDAEFEVRAITLSGLQITDLSLRPDDRLTVGAIDVGFDLSSLREGRVRTVRLTGLAYEIRVADGELDLGPIDDLVTPEGDGEASELPFDRIDIRSSAVLVEFEGQAIRVPLDGTVRNEGEGRLAGSIRPGAGVVDFDLLSLEHGDLLRLSGAVEDTALDLVVAGRRLHAPAVQAGAKLEMLDFASFGELKLRLMLRDLSLDGERIGDVHVVAQRGEGISWRVTLLSESLGMAQVEADTPATLDEITDVSKPQPFRFALQGRIAGVLQSRLAEAGIHLASPSALSADGSAVYRPRDDSWVIEDLKAVASFKTAGISLPGESLDLPATAGNIAVEGTASPDGLDLTIGKGSIGIGPPGEDPLVAVEIAEPGRIVRAGGALEIGLPKLSLRATEQAAALFGGGISWVSLSGDAAVSLRIREESTTALLGFTATEPFSAGVEGIEARFDRFVGSLEVVTDDSGLDWARGSAEVGLPKVVLGEGDLTMTGVSGNVPLVLGASIPFEGYIEAKKLTWGQYEFPDLEMRVTARPMRWAFDLQCPLSGEGRLRAEGEVDIGGDSVRGEATVRIPTFRAVRDDRVGKILRDLTGMELTGDFAAEGRVRLTGEGVVPLVNVKLTGGTVTAPKDAGKLTGVRMDLTVESLSPPATPGGQRVTWEAGSLGEFAMGPGALGFRLERTGEIFVEDLSWTLGRKTSGLGRFWASSFRLNPEALDIETTVYCDGLPLNAWLSLIAPEHAVGEGEIYGRLPLRIRLEPRLAIQLGNGYLYTGRKVNRGEGALYAERGGRIRVTGTEEMVRQYVPDTGYDQDYVKVVRNRIVHALEDFQYSKLRFDLLPKPDELTLRVSAVGKGTGVLPGTIGQQELDVTLNFNGVEKLIGPALGLGFTLGPRTGSK